MGMVQSGGVDMVRWAGWVAEGEGAQGEVSKVGWARLTT